MERMKLLYLVNTSKFKLGGPENESSKGESKVNIPNQTEHARLL